MTMQDIYSKSQVIGKLLLAQGATDVLYVGGFVRDKVLGIESRDIDMEVYGLSYQQIQEILGSQFSLDLVGKAFGIIKVDNQIDLNVPRRENKIGTGHQDFNIQLTPHLSPMEAAKRRDFTMNSMFMTLDERIIDPFEGQIDLKKRTLRATSEHYSEDALRVLRAMQFASRFNLVMDSNTMVLGICMLTEAHTLPKERIWEEWVKWAGGNYPSQGLQVLEQTGWLSLWPMLHRLKGLEQDPEWHPEGDVWQHTLHAVNAAAEICSRHQLNAHERVVVMLATLLHDIGKITTTVVNDKGRIVSPKHDKVGEEPAKAFLVSIGAPKCFIEEIIPLIREHMCHISLGGQVPSKRIINRLANRLHPATINLWAKVVEADHSARPPHPIENPVSIWEEMARDGAILEAKPQPILMGRHLIEFGVTPGPNMGRILKEAFEAQLDRVFTDLHSGKLWFQDKY